MDEENHHSRRTTEFIRSARNKRIVERPREGFGYDEIAREKRLTEQRVRQIGEEALEGREALESAIHARMQIDRLSHAMRVAADALRAPRRPGGRAVHQGALAPIWPKAPLTLGACERQLFADERATP